jgi:hypothetical protein
MKDRLSSTDGAIREAQNARDLIKQQSSKAIEELEMRYKKKVHKYKRRAVDLRQELESSL